MYETNIHFVHKDVQQAETSTCETLTPKLTVRSAPMHQAMHTWSPFPDPYSGAFALEFQRSSPLCIWVQSCCLANAKRSARNQQARLCELHPELIEERYKVVL